MQRLMFDGPATVGWAEAEEPSLAGPGAALARPVAVATCDLDVAALTGRFPLTGPHPFGHEGVVEVVEVGSQVTGIAPGDLAVLPFQISCGSCQPCQRGRTGNCAAHPFMSMYGLGELGGLDWGGLLADLIAVPHADAMLVKLPAGIDPLAVASASDNIADGWRTVAPHLAVDPGAEVLVVGGDDGACSIGLYAAGIAVALGAGRVAYLDHDPGRLAIAAALGAQVIDSAPSRKAGDFPITVDASGTPAGLRCALSSTAPDGVCTVPSIYRTDPAIPLFSMYTRCCTLYAGRAHARPSIPLVLDLVAAGFDPALVTSAVVPRSAAAEVLARPPMKLVIDCAS